MSFFLLVYDSIAMQLRSIERMDDKHEAADAFERAETEFAGDAFQVTLLQAESETALRRTHSSFFVNRKPDDANLTDALIGAVLAR